MQIVRDTSPSGPDLAVLPPQPAPSTITPPLPALVAQTALFLDFDGTLVELATQPEAVTIPAGLPALLATLANQLGGALAIVSGRTLVDLDRFLAPLHLPVAAEHGAQRRAFGQQGSITLAAPDLGAAVVALNAFSTLNSGLRVEVKSAAVALHYRHAPELEALCLQLMTDLVESTPGVELLHGKFVFEIKPNGITKGTAITDFMKHAPFKGRLPVFAGDDVTDEAAFASVQALGGVGIKVGPGQTLATVRCQSPADLLAWLNQAVDSLPRAGGGTLHALSGESSP